MKGIRNKLILLLLVTGFLFRVVDAQDWKQYPYTPEGSFITFPDDEGRHPDEAMEWWYMSGHLTGAETGNPYSFMLSYFYFPAYGYDGFRILNLCRDDTGEFYNDVQGLNYIKLGVDSLYIEALLMNDSAEWWFNKKDLDGNLIPFEYEITARGENGSLSLSSASLKAPLIAGDSGLFDQGSESYTYYYSLTDNAIHGNILFNGISEEVAGKAWIDKQYGSFSPASGEFYEWFSVNLSNGMDFVLWDIFTPFLELPNLTTHRHISLYVDSATQLTFHDYVLERLKWAYTPDGSVCYAQQWHLTSAVNQIDLIITTLNSHKDVTLPFRFYEGATRVTGTVDGEAVTGRGFTELVKSYEVPEPAIIYPNGGSWKDSLMIRWDLRNPDDGYNLLYDLEYSTDGGSVFTYIIQGLIEKKYMWKDMSDLQFGDSCWFRVSSYTPDHTLSGSGLSKQPSVFIPDTATSIGLITGEPTSGFVLYPVPAHNTMVVQNDIPQHYTYSIYDTAGKMTLSGVVKETSTRNTISLESFEPGIYMIVIKSQESDPARLIFIKL